MIVPHSRLLKWVAVVVVPFATLAGIVTGSAPLAITLVGLFIALVFLDAVRAFGSLDGIKIEVPDTVRLSKDRPGSIDLHISAEELQNKELRFGLALPRELQSSQEDIVALMPKEAVIARLSWPCTPVKRGNYPLNRCYVEGASPFGFWAIRRCAPVRGEVRVYPNLLSERKNVAALFLNRGNFGLHAQRQMGKGRDFEKLREYIPGDSYDEVHWKATAKRGKPVTKIFQIERTQEVYVIVDASRLSGRTAGGATDLGSGNGASPTTILERYITASLLLCMAAEQQGDLFGLLTFSDKVKNFVRAKNGTAHYNACRDAIYTLQPHAVTPDFDDLSTFIRLRLRRRALLIFLTALDDPILAESFTRNMELICRQHLIVVNMMQLPGVQPVFSGAKVGALDEIYQQLGGHILWQNLRELEKTLQRRGVRFSLASNEKLSVQLISQYLDIKRRQLL